MHLNLWSRVIYCLGLLGRVLEDLLHVLEWGPAVPPLAGVLVHS
jgi:hypothetical protein